MKQITRRDMLAATTAVGSFSFFPARVLGRGGATPPSDKLNIAMIGTGGRGAISLQNLKEQNIVALCDVDWRTESRSQFPAGKVAAQYPAAKRYDDYRKMLEEMDKSIDAVVVATPDHSHAHASITAMRMKKHVYCEKPLAHDMHEVRAMMAAAKKYKVITQTGNQGHSNYDVRSLVEWVRAGAIGSVKEVHLFEGAGRRPPAAAGPKVGTVAWQGQYNFTKTLNDEVPIPPEVKWDLWLGPAPQRRYNPAYLPLSWRRWLDFGTGVMGDFVCHYLDPVAWALDLELPETIEGEADEAYDPRTNNQTYPNYSQLRCAYPARGKQLPVTVSWYLNSPARPPRPQGWKTEDKMPDETGGGIIVGSQGSILFGKVFHGTTEKTTPGLVRLYPDELDKSYKREMTIPRLKGGGDLGGHWADWVESIKAGKPAGSHFGYGGILSKNAVLGNIALRNKGKILRFDSKAEKFTNDDEANKMFQRPYREGWKLPA